MSIHIAIGADHRGFNLKQYIMAHDTEFKKPIEWIDVGAFNDERSDYPAFAILAVQQILKGKAIYGILTCGTGVGMAIAANRFSGIYAGLAWNKEIARINKEDDNVNVLVIPADFVTNEQTMEMIRIWLNAEFNHGRYEQRIKMIDEIKS